MGNLAVGQLVRTLFSNTFQNGFFEEFLFRGALQSRLTRLLGSSWGLVISSLVFGAIHFGMNLRGANGDVAGAIAICVLVQAPLGLALGLMFHRTKSLLACSVVHVVINSV